MNSQKDLIVMITSICIWLELWAGVKPSCAYFHLILKTVPEVVTPSTLTMKGLRLREVKWLPQGHPVIARQNQDSASVFSFQTSYSTLCPHHHLTGSLCYLTGSLCYMAGSSWRNLKSKIPVRVESVHSGSLILAMLGVTEWVSFLRSFEMASPIIFFFSFGEL